MLSWRQRRGSHGSPPIRPLLSGSTPRESLTSCHRGSHLSKLFAPAYTGRLDGHRQHSPRHHPATPFSSRIELGNSEEFQSQCTVLAEGTLMGLMNSST